MKYAKVFKFKDNKSPKKLGNQLKLAQKRYFHKSDDVKYIFGLEGTDFADRKVTVKMETEI